MSRKRFALNTSSSLLYGSYTFETRITAPQLYASTSQCSFSLHTFLFQDSWGQLTFNMTVCSCSKSRRINVIYGVNVFEHEGHIPSDRYTGSEREVLEREWTALDATCGPKQWDLDAWMVKMLWTKVSHSKKCMTFSVHYETVARKCLIWRAATV